MTITVSDPAKDLLERLCVYHRLILKQVSKTASLYCHTGLVYNTFISFRLTDVKEAAERYNNECAAAMNGPHINVDIPDFRPFISTFGWPSPYDSYDAALRKYRSLALSDGSYEDASPFQQYLEKDVVMNMIQFDSNEELDLKLSTLGF